MIRALLTLIVFASVSCRETPSALKVSPPTLAEAEEFAKRFETLMSPCDPAVIEGAIAHDTLLARAVAGRAAFVRPDSTVRRAFSTMLCNLVGPNKYRYLRTQVVDGTPRPLFRLVIENGVNYHQLEVGKEGMEVRVADLYMFTNGQNLSEVMGTIMNGQRRKDGSTMISTLQRMNSLMASGKRVEALATLRTLPASVRTSKPMLLLEINLTSDAADEREYVSAIDTFTTAFPNDPALALIQYDGAVLRKKYEDALAIIDGLDHRVGGDPYLDVLRARVHGLAGTHAEGIAAAKRATERESTLEDAWWQLLTRQAAARDYASAIGTVETLRDKFAASVASLADDERFTGLVASPEYVAWRGK